MATSPSFIALEDVRLANPCRADWNKMRGDERTRFCSTCSKNVYNLSSMTRMEAEAFVREAEGEVCVRFYRRKDGTILTSDCPVGITASPSKPGFSSALIMMLLAPLFAVGGALGLKNVQPVLADKLQKNALVCRVRDWMSPRPPSYSYSTGLMTSSYQAPAKNSAPTSHLPKVVDESIEI